MKKFDERFLEIFDSNPIGMIISDLETTKFQYVNEIFLTSFGYEKSEVVGKTAIDLNLIGPESNEKVLSLLNEQGFARNVEVLGRKKNGETFWTLASVQLIAINDQKLAITSFFNISERKKVESELIIANEKLALQNEEKEKRSVELANVNKELLESQTLIKMLNQELKQKVSERTEELQLANKNMQDYKFALDQACIVAETDQNGTIQFVNDNFCKISKYSREELIGQNQRIIHSNYHSKEFACDLWATIANGNVWRGEIKNKAIDGANYWVDTTIVPFLNEYGNPNKYMAIQSDITQQKNFEENIIALNGELEGKVIDRTLELTELLMDEKELNELKSRCVSVASHEFRTPLSSILSSISLIDSYCKDEQKEKRDKHIERIRTTVKNLMGILNDFLSLDKLELGKVEILKETFDLYEFSSEIVEDANGILKQGQLINFSYQGEKEIHQDKRILRNVLLNLLSNAIKYSLENKIIHFTVKVSNNLVSIKVKDDGIGIPKEDQKNLFNKFFRAKNAVNIQGTGLGLNIVKRYVELLNGTISFISEPDNGTTFTIKFPQNKNLNENNISY